MDAKAAYLLAEAEKRAPFTASQRPMQEPTRLALPEEMYLCRIWAINPKNLDSVLADCQLVLSDFSLNHSPHDMEEEKPVRLEFGSRSRTRPHHEIDVADHWSRFLDEPVSTEIDGFKVFIRLSYSGITTTQGTCK